VVGVVELAAVFLLRELLILEVVVVEVRALLTSEAVRVEVVLS
jgi:hypothetical protein